MRIVNLNPLYEQHLAYLDEKAIIPSLWQREAAKAAAYGDVEFVRTDNMMQALHEMQRLRQIFLAGLEHDEAFRAEYDRLQLPSWHDFLSPPVEDALQKSLAEKLYNLDESQKEVAMIEVANGSKRIGELLLEQCYGKNADFVVRVTDPEFFNLVLKHIPETEVDNGVTYHNERVANLAADFLEQVAPPLKKRMLAAAGAVDGPRVELTSTQNSALYSNLVQSYRNRIRSGEIFFTLTETPTPKTAEIDRIDFKEYTTLFFEMCDQPWQHITAAQEILIQELNAAKTLRFTNDDGTDVSLNVEGFTFCNSVIAKNVPGSEVFSGPERTSVQGVIVSKGIFVPPTNRNAVIENLTLKFNQGALVEWHADYGQEHFEQAINVDDGAKFVGEIGIGTNPWLRRHVSNPLLVEKIGGSFHLALGGSYSFTEYAGVPVHVDNGNRSKIHWDITTMLYGKGGCMYADGQKIMDNGKFLNPAYDVLNRGWAAIPKEERPVYWQDHPIIKELEQQDPVVISPKILSQKALKL
ncbi:MAG: aminopeptidase [Alphaproteobacteria bacterium]